MGGKWLMLGMLIVSAEVAWAQAPPVQPDPSDPNAAVAPTKYRSAFDGFRNHSAVNVESWKDANENVGRIGGWREYLKEAHQPASTGPAVKPGQATPKDNAPPALPKHHGH